MNEKLAKEKNVIKYFKKIEKEGGFGNSVKDQNKFKEKLKEDHTKSDFLLLKERYDIEIETNKDTSFFYNLIITVLITALTLLCTLMVCFFTISTQVMTSAINTKVTTTIAEEKFKKMSSVDQNDLLTGIYSPIKKEINDLVLGGFFPFIAFGTSILIVGILVLMYLYTRRVKKTRYYHMLIIECISDIEDKEKELKQRKEYRRKTRH
ncbi:hypothetical protein MHH30_18300 [Bacillus sp. FSL K6-5915]|uniref:hypothetical protein n=1 Tax=Bacillus TaxID=1386 RepID=UPI000BA73719|nr:hypothetical protein [Bacillus licheniformis]AVI47093.1 hypothetical protein BL14DL4_01864 [Bacillus licheniformis]MBS2764303.1 hypothetical protein [Bacillus licheniformis]PAE41434.1 hypothetical protein CHH96_03525 [Bacillus licheniformis]PAE72411.1 hypothetical protein CHH84_10365 [Bacillus licheniformis]QBR21654.1 hypothetical protein EYQ98_19045 [Bacillus licheniformis]